MATQGPHETSRTLVADILAGATPSLMWHKRDGDPGPGGTLGYGVKGDVRLYDLWGDRSEFLNFYGLRTSSPDIQLIGWYKDGERPAEDEEGNDISPDPVFYLKYSYGHEAASVRPLEGGTWHKIEIIRPALKPGTCIYDDWTRGEAEPYALPIPPDGFVYYCNYEPPGRTQMHWYPDREAAAGAVEFGREEIVTQGLSWSDSTPEGSTGSREEAVWAVGEIPEPVLSWHAKALEVQP